MTEEAHLRAFRASPVADHYFAATLALLQARGIGADFVVAPVNADTWSGIDPAVRDGFAAYLRGYAERYPNLRIIGGTIPHWPDRFFGDGLLHMNPAGAELFSRRLAECLSQRPDQQACDLGPDAAIRTGRLER